MGLRDPVSSATHLLAAGWAAYATLVLIRLAPPHGGRRAAAAVYGLSLTLLYLASGVYHGVRADPATLAAFHAADRAAIFLLIAGTNTPPIVALIAGRWRWWWLGAMWVLAVVGIAVVWTWPAVPYPIAVGLYVGLGWFGAVPIVPFHRAVGWRGVRWAVAGGVLYTAGALCDLFRWPAVAEAPVRVGPHEVFHLAVVAAGWAFFVFVVRHVLPGKPGGVTTASPPSGTSPPPPRAR